jgi:2'-5' RNA ligase
VRLFVALEPPEEVRRAIDERVAAERGRLPAANWVRPENLHLTLVFLGELPETRVLEAERALAAAAAACAPANEVTVAAAGGFPERGPIRVVWLGLEPVAELARIADALRAAARAAGLPFDAKPFRAHLTLARCRRPWPAALRAELTRLAPAPPASFRAARAALVASVLGGGGPRYTTVAGLPLGEAA